MSPVEGVSSPHFVEPDTEQPAASSSQPLDPSSAPNVQETQNIPPNTVESYLPAGSSYLYLEEFAAGSDPNTFTSKMQYPSAFSSDGLPPGWQAEAASNSRGRH